MEKRRILQNPVEMVDLEGKKKPSKYKNKRVLLTDAGTILKPEHVLQLRGMGMIPQSCETFDSELEAQYFRDELLPRVVAGKIEVQRQPKFVLLKEFVKDGVAYKPIHYIPDFLVTNLEEKSTIAIDVKGFENDVFLLKRKLFDAAFPDVKLLILKNVRKYGGWITVEEYAAHKKRERKEFRSLPSRTQGRKRRGSDVR